MFCKNCGNQMDENAAICVKCGFQKGHGNKFCSNCGNEVTPGASICVNCGCALTNVAANVDTSAQKSRLVAGILGIFLGAYGVHNFYLGYTGKAVAQLLISVLSCFTLAPASAIWGLIEGILVLTNKDSKDAKGNPLKD